MSLCGLIWFEIGSNVEIFENVFASILFRMRRIACLDCFRFDVEYLTTITLLAFISHRHGLTTGRIKIVQLVLPSDLEARKVSVIHSIFTRSNDLHMSKKVQISSKDFYRYQIIQKFS